MKLPEPRITAGEWQLTTWAEHLPSSGWPSAIYGWGEGDVDEPCVEVCCFDDPETDKNQTEHNARAIAALPKLLAACKQAAERGDTVCEAAYREAVEG